MGRTLKWIVITLWLSALPRVGTAHHSTAYFADEYVELEGVITSVDWRNPHVSFMLEAREPDGGTTAWRLVSNSLYDLKRAGITRDYLNVAAKVKIAGHPSKLEQHVALATNMMLADGTEVVMRRDAEPYWSKDAVGGREQWLAGEASAGEVAPGRGIFQVWSASEIRAENVHYPYTARARKAQASWNPLDNFLTHCRAPGMPYLMTSPHPHQFVEHGDRIELRVAWFDQTRTIYLGAPPTSAAPGPLGISVGHWEGRTLVVETSAVDWPYSDRSGTPQSPDVAITERFALSDDEQRLDYRMTIVDALAYTAPATYETTWLARGETIEPYDCEVF